MKNREIYKKITCFVWPRVPLIIVGGFILVYFPYVAVRLTEKMKGFLPNFIIAAMSAAGILIAKNISFYGKKSATLAQISMTARAVVYGVLPADVKREGYRVAKYHFKNISVGDLSKQAFRTFYHDIIKKEETRSDGEKHGRVFALELKTFAELFILNALPFVGEFALAWEFVYPGTTFEESICDSSEVLLSNWLRLTLLFLALIILLVIKIILTILISGTILVLLLGFLYSLKNASDLFTGLTDFFSKAEALEDTLVLMLPEYLAVIAAFPFFRSSIRIKMFRCFFKGADRKAPTGRIYAKLGNTVRKLRCEAEQSSEGME